jgi:hypothetical protein
MTNIRPLLVISFLVTLGLEAAIAMPPQEIPAEVKSCKAIADDKERLKCFDGLFGETLRPQNPQEEKQANWSIDETKSPTDGSPRVVAANLVSDTVLILRCKDQITEAAFSTKYNYLGSRTVDFSCVSMTKIQSSRFGRRQWMAAPLLLQRPWLSFSPWRTMESCR